MDDLGLWVRFKAAKGKGNAPGHGIGKIRWTVERTGPVGFVDGESLRGQAVEFERIKCPGLTGSVLLFDGLFHAVSGDFYTLG